MLDWRLVQVFSCRICQSVSTKKWKCFTAIPSSNTQGSSCPLIEHLGGGGSTTTRSCRRGFAESTWKLLVIHRKYLSVTSGSHTVEQRRRKLSVAVIFCTLCWYLIWFCRTLVTFQNASGSTLENERLFAVLDCSFPL